MEMKSQSLLEGQKLASEVVVEKIQILSEKFHGDAVKVCKIMELSGI